MPVSVQGNKIVFTGSADSLILNCPIKKIVTGGGTINLAIDGYSVFLSNSTREYVFPSLNGYPGGVLSVASDLAGSVAVFIEEIGDVLNPNYFKEDIRNWNGQGATASVSETEAKARSRTKKAEVTE